MCECGCGMGLTKYRLPAPDGKMYVVELYPGCKDCSTGPAVYIRFVDKSVWDWEEVREAAMLPTFGFDGDKQAGFRCGLPADEFKKAAGKIIHAGARINREGADEIAEEIWDEIVRSDPQVIETAVK